MKFNSYKTNEGNNSVRAYQVDARGLQDYLVSTHTLGMTDIHKDSPAPEVGDWLVFYAGEDSAHVLSDTYFQANFHLFNADDYFRTGKHKDI